jgi:osmotically-inducible protein OsmY
MSTVVLLGACAGSSNEERATAEQRERMAEQRAAERQEAEPIPSQFDHDGDGEVESAELKKSGVSEGAIEGLEEDGAIEGERNARAHASDAEITDGIRDKLADHDDLSRNAKNVRISTANGKVTLRGPVESAEEKSKVESCAREVAGADVDNQLEVTP